MRAVLRIAALALMLVWAGWAAAQVAVPPLTGRVVDQTATLSGADLDALTQKLKAFEDRKGSQIAILIVPTTQPETIEQFSIRVAEAWKVGRQRIDDGAILVVAKNDRHLRIEVGYGLEGSLTDATARRIIDEDITPKFKQGDFAGGIDAGVSRMIRVIDGEKLPAPEPPHWRDDLLSHFDPFNPFVLVALYILAAILRTIFGRLFGSIAAGGITAVVVFVFVGSMIASLIAGVVVFMLSLVIESFGSGTGGYSSGSSGRSSGGWGGGSSSSSSGSWSGGGGSFGGGGASGSW